MKGRLKMIEELFCFKGRLNRLRFFGYDFILGLILIMLKVFIEATENDATLIIISILVISILVSLISVSVRRLHDIELSGWFVLLNFVPVINFILELVLLFKKGTDGPNIYGKDPLEIYYEDSYDINQD